MSAICSGLHVSNPSANLTFIANLSNIPKKAHTWQCGKSSNFELKTSPAFSPQGSYVVSIFSAFRNMITIYYMVEVHCIFKRSSKPWIFKHKVLISKHIYGLNSLPEIVLRWIPENIFDDKPTLVQVMAWCHQAASHCLNQFWHRSMSPFGITGPQS